MSFSLHKRVVVLTGSLGSGKSSAAQVFKELGCPVVSADELTRELVRPRSESWQEIARVFGSSVFKENQEIDRKLLGNMVFSDVEKRRALEAIIHPRVHKLAHKRLENLLTLGSKLVVYECPLFFECGLDRSQFLAVIMVYAPPESCLRRIQQRDGLSRNEALTRFASQMDINEKKSLSDFVIENAGSEIELRTQVENILRRLTSLPDYE